MTKRKADDLNEGLKRRKYQKGDVVVLFEPKKILKELIYRISRSYYVVGCIAWFTNSKVLKALEKTKGCAFVVTKHKMAKIFKPTYDILPVFGKGKAFTQLGSGRGITKNLMHHKFVVGLNKDKKPTWVASGSFNITRSAESNLENIMIMNDTDIARQYYNEFKRIRQISNHI